MDQRIDIDWTACEAHGLRAELLPEHVSPDEWGYPLVGGTPVAERTAKRPVGRPRTAQCSPSDWRRGECF
jgi:ferredoxin